jgi:hypothetical protein
MSGGGGGCYCCLFCYDSVRELLDTLYSVAPSDFGAFTLQQV